MRRLLIGEAAAAMPQRQVVSATRQLPFGFAHLVLEECREAALEDRRRGVPILTEARALVTQPAMAEGQGKELRDLEARAVAYLAVAHCWIRPTLETLAEVLDARITAFTLLVESHRLRRDGTGDAELEATLREITGRLGLSMGFTDDAVELFASAERLLDHPDHLGRRAEAMLQRAVALFAGERWAAGRAAVLTALELEHAMVQTLAVERPGQAA